MEKLLFQVNKKLTDLEIKEIKYTKKTRTYYCINNNFRIDLETIDYKSFDKKDDAIKYLKYLIEMEIFFANFSLQQNNKKLKMLKKKFKIA